MRSINVGFVFVLALLIVACSNNQNTDKTSADTEKKSTEKIYPVRIEKLQKQSIPRNIEYTANLIAFKEIHYAPATPGRIHKIYVEVGDRITKGQVLVEMDKTQLNQAITQLLNVELNYRRIDTLNQLGSISEQQYDQIKTQYELAKSNVDFLKENTKLLSPINGIVTGKYFENGEMFNAVPNTSAGKAAIISLVQIHPLKAIVNITQSYFPYVKEGMKATITTDIFSGRVFHGSVYKVYPTIDPNTRTFKTEIIIQNPKERLRPGMYSNIELKLGNAEALVVPSIAILKEEGTNNRYVFINDNGVARKIGVKIGKRFDDKIEIMSDKLEEGEELIIEGQASLMNNSKIKILSK